MTQNKRTGGRQARPSKNQLPPELEAILAPIAEQAVEQRQTLGQAMHGGPLAQLIGRFVELALQGEMSRHLEQQSPDAGYNVRNGSFSRQLVTEFGKVEVQRPRDRNASFEPAILPKHGQLSDTIASQIISLYTRGMTTRDIRKHLSELYHTDFDDDLVSRVMERVEPELVEWRNRALPDIFACVFVDCLYIKMRHETSVENTAVYVAMGYDMEGMQHILGTWVAEEGQTAESASFWHKILIELKKRGVKDIFILCSDGLSGMEKAVEVVYPATRHQTCVVHLIRNSTKSVACKHRAEVCADARKIYQAVSFEKAQQELKQLSEKWNAKYPEFVNAWTRAMPKIERLWDYGEALRKMVYTTNALENINRIIRKGTKTRSSFPNLASGLRLVTLILKQTQEGYKRARGDWSQIRAELLIHFGDRLQ